MLKFLGGALCRNKLRNSKIAISEWNHHKIVSPRLYQTWLIRTYMNVCSCIVRGRGILKLKHSFKFNFTVIVKKLRSLIYWKVLQLWIMIFCLPQAMCLGPLLGLSEIQKSGLLIMLLFSDPLPKTYIFYRCLNQKRKFASIFSKQFSTKWPQPLVLHGCFCL